MQLGGAQRVMSVIVNHYVELGNKVVLVNDIKPLDDCIEYTINPRVRRIFLSSTKVNNSNYFRIKKLRRIIKDEKPDTVLSFLGPPNYRMLVATLFIKTRKIVSVRNDPYREYGKGIKRVIANILFCLANCVVFQTEEASLYFFRNIRNKSQVIYNPVDDSFYNHHWCDKSHDIIYVGRLQTQKNPLLLMKSFEKIAQKHKDTNLRYYGSGGLKEMLVDYAEKHSLSGRVFFHGQTTDIPKVLEKARLYVLCSDYEGMPNALIEAMAVGVPSISTDCPCGGPHEIIKNQSQGILVPCDDVEQMSFAIDVILSDENLRKRMSKEASKRAESFKKKTVLEQWNHVLL